LNRHASENIDAAANISADFFFISDMDGGDTKALLEAMSSVGQDRLSN
jgi:hypothetical protein